MKNKITVFALVALFLSITSVTYAQKTKTIKLEQTKGEFKTKSLELKEGTTYVFEIENNGVDHKVGFVIAPKGMTDQAHHIKEAYVKKTIANGEKSKTSEVKLKKGTYVYFLSLIHI